MIDMSTPKGMKDYLPEEQILREKVLAVLSSIFEKYGFSPLDTPTVEKLEVLTVKGGGGSEVGKEIFTLKDRKGRKLGLRFDLTVPLARVVASTPTIQLPFKRYQIGKVFRQEFGTRTREFYQCDVDTVGTSDPMSDAEMLAISQDVFKALGLKVTIKYSSRTLLKKILTDAGVPESKQVPLIMEIDKLEKGTGKVPPKILRAVKSAKVTDDSYLDQMSKILKKLGVKAVFDPTLARGLEYYTGPVFEVSSTEYKSSIAAGGRYDKLLKQLGGRDLPATGISFGLTRICEILSKKMQKQKSVAQVLLIPIGTQIESAKVAQQLRDAGVKVDFSLKAPSRALTYASKLGIPYAVFVGEKELKQGKLKLKDMKTGKENLVTISQLVKNI